MKVLRSIAAVIAGLVVAFVFVQAAETITHRLYPFPPGSDMHDMATIKKFVSTLPAPAFAIVLGGWFVGTLLGTFAAAKIGRSRIPAYVVGVLLLAGGIMNSVMIPQPVWFSAFSFLIYILAIVAGVKVGQAAIPSVAE